jgi:hypothetical protein
LLVELEPELARRAQGAAKVRVEDAGNTDAYRGHVPADVIMACGVFGNISLDDVRTTITLLPTLAAAGATVIWTRGQDQAGTADTVRQFFADAGFAELSFTAERSYSVGVHRMTRAPAEYQAGRTLFTFRG